MKYLRAWMMRTFGLVDRELFESALRGEIDLLKELARANNLLTEANEQLERLEEEVRTWKHIAQPVALADALKKASNA